MTPLFQFWVLTISGVLLYLGVNLFVQFGQVQMKILPFICLIWGGLQFASLWRNTIVLILCCLMNTLFAGFLFWGLVIHSAKFENPNPTGWALYSASHLFFGFWPLYDKWKSRTL